MSNQITRSNFQKALKKWADPQEHSYYLAPFFTIQEAEKANIIDKDKELLLWIWSSKKSVNKCQEIIWQLTGEWKARRGITIKNPNKFHEEVTFSISNLSKIFNKYRIASLRDMKELEQNNYEEIVSEIEEYISRISKMRKTREIQPVLGSKVIHHFFPSIVPVYDDEYISQGVLKSKPFKEFLKSCRDEWVFNIYKNQSRLQEYHYYFAYCAQQICNADFTIIKNLRNKMAYLFQDLSPFIMVKKKRSILWKLDAKIAEYCLMGSTY